MLAGAAAVGGWFSLDKETRGVLATLPTNTDLLFWSQPQRDAAFRALDRLSVVSKSHVVAASGTASPLPAGPELKLPLDVDAFMAGQRSAALLVLHDGKVVAERSSYERKPEHRLLSNSMAKTIVALGIGKALEEGRIRSLDDTAAIYEPKLAGTLYGDTKIINLMRMASGAKFVEDYSGKDDLARFHQTTRTRGNAAGAQVITERVAPEGTVFNYASAETQMLGLVLRGATGQSLCQYIGEKIWQPLGAESRATWLTNPVDQTEQAGGNFNATVHDYARLGLLLANDGVRDGKAVVARDYLLRMTDASQQPPAFRPGTMQNKGSTYAGYGLQTWLWPGSHRRFALLGIYGQAIFVDPELKLVIVHMAVAKDASGDASGTHMGQERNALWRGIVAAYGNW